MTPTEALQLIATPQRPDGTWNRDREACRKIAADALASMTTPTDPTAAANTGHGHVRPRPDGVKARCGGPAMCNVCQQERAAIDALPAPSGEPVAEIDREGVLWLNTNPHRLPIGTKLYAGATAQAAPAPQAASPAPAVPAESGPPNGYEAITPVYTRWVSPSRWAKFSPAVQKWYRPYWLPAVAATAQAAPAPQAEPTDEEIGHVTIEQARAALDSMDDFARMKTGVDAMGPRRTLEVFIAQAEAAPAVAAPVQPLTIRQLADITAPWSFIRSDHSLGIAQATERACAAAWGVTLAATPAKE